MNSPSYPTTSLTGGVNRQEEGPGGSRLNHAILHARLPIMIAGVAVVLSAPALWVGLQMDDYIHRAMLTKSSTVSAAIPDLPTSPLDLFSFRKGEPESNVRWMARGLLPWWSNERLRLTFWRPLSAATHWLDYALWPNAPALMHLHSLLWLGALVSVVGVLYRRILGPTWAAGLAAILFGLDDAHGFVAGWLANRNALVATTFGVLSLIAHDHYRRDASRTSADPSLGASEPPRPPAVRRLLIAGLGPAVFLLALLAGEVGIGTAAYLFAYAVVVDRARGRDRFLSLSPYFGIGLVWAAAYVTGGYGVTGSAIYTDPVTQPAKFAHELIQRLPILLSSQVVALPADLTAQLSKSSARLLCVAATIFCGGLAVAFAPLLRRDAHARFWACGMLLSLVPVCATIPQARLLVFPGIGAMGLMAQFVAATRDTAPRSARQFMVTKRVLPGFLLVLHLILSPILLPLCAFAPAIMGRSYLRAADSLPLEPQLAQQRLVLVNAPYGYLATLITPMRILRDQPAPMSVWLLAPTLASVTIERIDSRTLRVRPARGFLREPGASVPGDAPPPSISKSYIYERWNGLFCDPREHFPVGRHIDLGAIEITITDANPEGLPLEALFQFDTPLEDPSLRWMQWQGGRLVPFTVPAPGESVTLRTASPP